MSFCPPCPVPCFRVPRIDTTVSTKEIKDHATEILRAEESN